MKRVAPLTKGEKTRARIVEAASNLFWLRNFHGVSVDLVAEEAQVNKATVYRYFADKADLALAVVKYNGAITLEVVFAQIFAKHDAPNDRLAAIYQQVHCSHSDMRDRHGDTFGCPIVGLALELGQELPEVRKEAQSVFEEVERYFAIIAADAIALGQASGPVNALARTLTQLIHGANASSRLSGDPAFILDAGFASLSLIGFPDTPIPEMEIST